MLRLSMAALVLLILIAGATILHLFSTAYLLGVVSGLVLGMTLWMRSKPRN